MFAKNSKAYSVYLLFRFVCSLAVSMSTVLSIVYHLEVVQLDAFQLVLVGTVLETSCFLFEIPTGVVADLYSRRRSVLIGMFLYGLGFLMEGALPWFAPVLLAQVVWGCGDTFITGALEAWIASEEEDKPIDKVELLTKSLVRGARRENRKKKDAYRRHPIHLIILFKFKAVAERRQWSSAASNPRRKTRVKLCPHF